MRALQPLIAQSDPRTEEAPVIGGRRARGLAAPDGNEVHGRADNSAFRLSVCSQLGYLDRASFRAGLAGIDL